ncbi:MAG TPA: gamma carbonic anhydrase family protein [Firmicutes bacterium]|nr:gamma carbonic anhydrase family protein [Bacillota bacterium]
MAILPYQGKTPTVPESCTIFEQVSIYGDVTLGENCVVLPQVVMRAEHNAIVIGNDTNIQDGCLIHTEIGEGGGVNIGSGVTVGHGAILHGCTLKDRCMIGMGAVIQDGAVVEEECLIAAGAVVTPGTVIPKGHLAAGLPAKVRRPLTQAEIQEIDATIEEYRQYAAGYKEALQKNQHEKEGIK